MRWIVVAGAVFLAGCQTDGVVGVSQICQALIGPIKYNTYNTKSLRYAGVQLAPDLKQRNEVGMRLGCQQFRTW